MRKRYRGINENQTKFGDFIREVAFRTNSTVSEADILVRTVFDVIKNYLYNKHALIVPNFGEFFLAYRKSKMHRTHTNTKIFISAHIVPYFSFCKKFRDSFKDVEV